MPEPTKLALDWIVSWEGRRETPMQCAKRIKSMINQFSIVYPVCEHWYSKHTSTQTSQNPIDCDNEAYLASMLEAGMNRADDNRSKIADLGYYASMFAYYNHTPDASIECHCGAYASTATNRVWFEANVSMNIHDIALHSSIMQAMIKAWDPDSAFITDNITFYRLTSLTGYRYPDARAGIGRYVYVAPRCVAKRAALKRHRDHEHGGAVWRCDSACAGVPMSQAQVDECRSFLNLVYGS